MMALRFKVTFPLISGDRCCETGGWDVWGADDVSKESPTKWSGEVSSATWHRTKLCALGWPRLSTTQFAGTCRTSLGCLELDMSWSWGDLPPWETLIELIPSEEMPEFESFRGPIDTLRELEEGDALRDISYFMSGIGGGNGQLKFLYPMSPHRE